jgi:dTDP-L-rhamnose 4-epimerase
MRGVEFHRGEDGVPSKSVLVTGGAGFIGSHLADALLERGYRVRIFDNLEPQVHGEEVVPDYLNRESEFIRGDVRDRETLSRALKGVEVVFHHAAAVGVGQSMYEIRRYVETNTLGSANLLDILANEEHKVERLVVASSMSIYGEGKYLCPHCGVIYPKLRPDEQLKERRWEMRCPHCGREAKPEATDEDKPLYPSSIYAITKQSQEESFLCFGRAYGIPTVALRYFNVYGPRQALSNPYTGVAAIFSARLLNGHPPVVYEDGLQSRDFIHVRDIVEATLLATEQGDYEVFNVGTGRPLTVLEMARILIEKLGGEGLEPQIVGQYRRGDIRHCYADITKIQKGLGFKPRVKFEEGISDLITWVSQEEAIDRFQEVEEELASKSLVV